MNKKDIEKIFKFYRLGKLNFFSKVEIGFTNEVYIVNDDYVLKVCKDKNNEKNFEKEVFFYNFFKNKFPVPDVKVFDKTKKIYKKVFIIYPKIEGDNLYSKWHLLNNKERKTIIRQLCSVLKIINKAPYDSFLQAFNEKVFTNWEAKIVGKIEKSLKKIEQKKLLSSNFIKIIKEFIKNNRFALEEQKLALVYWDAHFDNILVKKTKIVGILDFERTEISSIDFGLDIIKRMKEYPKKYMSEKNEPFARKKDYAQLLRWFKEFYPALFKFKNLNKRLALYALEHDLDTLVWYPKSVEVRQMVAKTVNIKDKSSLWRKL